MFPEIATQGIARRASNGQTAREHTLSGGSDRELARQAAAGEAGALACLIERHYDRIHRLAWRLTGSQTDAEDVAQEVCVKLATAIRSFRGDADPGTWIWRITYNAATDVLRARQRIRPVEPSEMVEMIDRASAGQGMAGQGMVGDGERVAQGELSDGLWTTVQRLPPKQRDAVMLVYGEEMSHAAAAEVMGCSEKTVSWHLHEARKRLKTMLEPVG